MSKDITPEVRTIADGLKESIALDLETGTGTLDNAEDVFAKYLPEGKSIEDIKSSVDFVMNCANAQTLAFGELSQKAMQEHKELNQTSLKTKAFYSSFETSYDRKRSGTAMGKAWAKYGVVSTDVTIGVGRKSTTYKNVVAYLGEEGASVFSN